MGGIFKSIIRGVAEELFGVVISSFVSDLVVLILGLLFLGTISILIIWRTIQHFSTPICEHKRRGVCYQCDPLIID